MSGFIGTDRQTGTVRTEHQHIEQSIMDILTTRVGTRVMRRDYGSILPDLVDKPLNDEGLMKMMAATAIAIMQWEPRVKLTRVLVEPDELSGKVKIECEGVTLKTQQPFSFERGYL